MSAYSGLVRMRDGSLAFTDTDCEERWIRAMCEQQEAKYADMEREREIDEFCQEERDRWAAEDDEWPWRRREKPRGLMYGLADHHQQEEG